MLQFLPYALAAYGGYKGYKASKDAGGSGIQRLLAGATGAVAGYYGGKGILGGGSALNIPGFSTAQANFTPFLKTSAMQTLGTNFPFLGIPTQTTAASTTPFLQKSAMFPGEDALATDSISKLSAAAKTAGSTVASGPGGKKVEMNALQKLLFRNRIADGKFTGELQIDPFKAAFAVGAGTYLGGAFDPQAQTIYTPGYNLGVAELQEKRGGLKYIDPETGEEKTYAQVYIPEAGRNPEFQIGNIEMNKFTYNKGGLAEIKRFNEGGINFLPSKTTHDENDSNNYVRAMGYVEDGSGTGDKDEDTMLAQLADGEFVTRADGVLGAGIIAGGNPSSIKDMREKGASYFYEQQKRFKRVYDLLQKGKDAESKTVN